MVKHSLLNTSSQRYMQNNNTYILEEHIVNFLHSNRVFQAPSNSTSAPLRWLWRNPLKSLGPFVGSEKNTTERIPHDIIQSLLGIATNYPNPLSLGDFYSFRILVGNLVGNLLITSMTDICRDACGIVTLGSSDFSWDQAKTHT